MHRKLTLTLKSKSPQGVTALPEEIYRAQAPLVPGTFLTSCLDFYAIQVDTPHQAVSWF